MENPPSDLWVLKQIIIVLNLYTIDAITYLNI